MQSIQLAFATSSQALLGLLQHDLGLNNTLAALKHYFLLDKGDLLVSFLDNAEEELSKPASEVSVIRLQSLLDLGQLLVRLPDVVMVILFARERNKITSSGREKTYVALCATAVG